MNSEQMDKILSYLDKVGEKIGATGQQIWPWLVKQQYIDAFTSLFFLIVFGMMFWFSYNKFINIKWVNGEPEEWGVFVFFVISCIGLFVSFVCFLVNFFDIFNPEYWALMDLLNKIR